MPSRTALALGTIFCVLAAGLLMAGCGQSDPTSTVRASQFLSGEGVYRVPSGSMEPTLGIGARVRVSHGAPKVGDIIVLYPPEGAVAQECGPAPHTVKPGGAACAEPVPRRSNVKFIKRIIAGPGDEIYIKEGHVYRRAAGTGQFVREHDPYIRACGPATECNFLTPITIPAGKWFTMGDNRGESDDSRFWGPVPTSWIVGVVTACATPPAHPRTLGEQMSIHACRLPK
jgi:signal peptidase I